MKIDTTVTVYQSDHCICYKKDLNAYNHALQNSSRQPDQVKQDTLIYADIGPSSLNKKAKHAITLKPEDMDDRVEYALLNHNLQRPVITTNQDSIAGKHQFLCMQLLTIQE